MGISGPQVRRENIYRSKGIPQSICCQVMLVVEANSQLISSMQQVMGLVRIGLAQIFLIELLYLGVLMGLAQLLALVLAIQGGYTLDGLLAREIVKYTRSNKRIRFHLTESSSENLMDLIRQEKLDMAIVDSYDRDRSLHFRKLFERNFFVAMPCAHPLVNRSFIHPQEVVLEPQVVFNYDVGRSFKEWTTGAPTDEAVICTVDTSRAALDLVAAGIGITFIPNECVENRPDVRYVPLRNWHQALYMCILYDKWLEPPVWDFIEGIVKILRSKKSGT